MYKILMEFRQIEHDRYKCIDGEWHPGGKTEPSPANAVCCETFQSVEILKENISQKDCSPIETRKIRSREQV